MARLNDLYKLLRKESGTLFEGAHNVYTPVNLVEKILKDVNVKTAHVLVLYNPEFVIKMIQDGTDPNNITFFSDHVNKNKLIEKFNVRCINQLEKDMKFDRIVGNPPYQDGTKDGGQNKIYNQISKTALDHLADDGEIAFITPASVLKKSKRFSLVGMQGLKTVDFNADSYFKEGIKICYWVVDKKHTGDVTVRHRTGQDIQSKDIVIYDYSEVDKDFTELYEALKTATDTPEKRMFKQNNFGPAMSKTKSKDHVYPLYKLEAGEKKLTYWSSRVPYFVDDTKITIGMTKSLDEDAIIVDTNNFDVAYMTTNVHSEEHVENIKSFILSDYFKKHCERWKNVDGYGYNYALKYLPPFDINKQWTDEDVKSFIEGFK